MKELNIDGIPSELKEKRQWICWKKESRAGKETKIPYIPMINKFASATNPQHFTPFETALESVTKKIHDGIGFVISPPYCFTDHDHCIDENGNIDPETMRMIKLIDSYTEISISGRGIHTITKATLPEGSGNRRGNFEIYTHDRYCAMTGNVLDGFPGVINERQEQVNQICAEIFGKKEAPEEKKKAEVNLTDKEIFEKACKSKNGGKFKRLYQGDFSDYKSHSEADLALCCELAFWTQDEEQINRLFSESGLYREKWKREDYRMRTIKFAVERTGESYKAAERTESEIEPVTESVTDEEIPEQPLADVSGLFKERTFIPSRLADELMTQYKFIFSAGTLYVYQDGVYLPIGFDFIQKKCAERLGESFRINRVHEVSAYIQYINGINVNELNQHTKLINLKNGMYHIDTGELFEHNKDYLSTIRIPVSYNPDVDRSGIADWLNTTLEDAGVVQLALEMFGYILIPDVIMNKAFMLVGSGANGKSTFLTVLERFLGSDNVSKVPLQELSDHRFKRAELFGKLANIFADLDSRSLESTTYFKTIVSGDSIDAERKNQNPFSFRPYARLIFSANEIPRSRDRSFAYYRRWDIIPFDKQFTGTEDKKGYADELSKPDNLSALFNCAIYELNRVIKRGSFSEPPKIKDALAEYEKQNDPVTAFVKEYCIFDPQSEIERGELYNFFCRYCEEQGFKSTTRNQFYQRMRIFTEVSEKKIFGGQRAFFGIKYQIE